MLGRKRLGVCRMASGRVQQCGRIGWVGAEVDEFPGVISRTFLFTWVPKAV